MTEADVRRRVATIRAYADGDDESAHSEEDKLRGDVLRAIAAGIGDDPSILAAAVLETSDIDFHRWCA